jgi:hypothetical protein
MAQGSIRGGQNLEFVDTGPSRRLWADCPWDDIGGTVRGLKFFDDFENVAAVATNLTAATGKYAVFTGATGTQTFAQVADRAQATTLQGFGEAALTASATDNMDVTVQTGGNTGGLASFRDPAVATPHDIWLEARFKINQITSGNAFVGFANEGGAVTGGIVTALDVLITGASGTNGDIIGFGVFHALPSTLAFVYKRGGVADASKVVPIASLHTFVADTYVTVGFHYRYAANPEARKLCVFKNNALQTVGVARTAIVTATFPTVDALALSATVMTNGAAAKVLTLDWLKFASVEN